MIKKQYPTYRFNSQMSISSMDIVCVCMFLQNELLPQITSFHIISHIFTIFKNGRLLNQFYTCTEYRFNSIWHYHQWSSLISVSHTKKYKIVLGDGQLLMWALRLRLPFKLLLTIILRLLFRLLLVLWGSTSSELEARLESRPPPVLPLRRVIWVLRNLKWSDVNCSASCLSAGCCITV